ncbi:ESX secretion system protein YukD [Geobacillus icigianus]|nr:ESX secretion system protein YukD [Geobacillus icigianus]
MATGKLIFYVSMYRIGGLTAMYIQVTVDLRYYTQDTLDLRLSDLYSIKKIVEIVWQIKNISTPPREGCWVRVENKQAVFPGCATLQASGITNGDRIVVL